MYKKYFPVKRYKETLAFLKEHIPDKSSILDLGVENPFTAILKEQGYQVTNTAGEDLDVDTSEVKNNSADVTTALQILEHMVSPMHVLQDIPSKKLIASVPLRLWFAKAYRNKSDERDQHFHEFEDWQFDWLLEKAGWKIKAKKKWTNPVKKIGFRPILRLFTPRYYIVYAERD
ncbi:MAG: methyltransferase [bacterium]